MDGLYLRSLLAASGTDPHTSYEHSSELWAKALPGVSPPVLSTWLSHLGQRPQEDFLDHAVPFIRNVVGLGPAHRTDALLDLWMGLDEPHGQTPAGRHLYREFPDSLIIEITASCNFACRMCSSRTGGFLAERTMSAGDFGRVVELLGRTASRLRVNGYGETALVPDLGDYLDCLDAASFSGVREMITNLSAPLATYQDILARGFVVLASWDAVDRDLFEWIRQGSDFTAMAGTLRCLVANEGGRNRVGLLATIQEANLHQVVALVEFAGEVGVAGILFNMVSEADGSPWMAERLSEIRDAFTIAVARGDALGIVVRVPDRVAGRRLRLRGARRTSSTFCDRPWTEVMVHWDLELTTCNMFNPFSYGVLGAPDGYGDWARRFRRLWNGPNAALFRHLINSSAPHPYCVDCAYLSGSYRAGT